MRPASAFTGLGKRVGLAGDLGLLPDASACPAFVYGLVGDTHGQRLGGVEQDAVVGGAVRTADGEPDQWQGQGALHGG